MITWGQDMLMGQSQLDPACRCSCTFSCVEVVIHGPCMWRNFMKMEVQKTVVEAASIDVQSGSTRRSVISREFITALGSNQQNNTWWWANSWGWTLLKPNQTRNLGGGDRSSTLPDAPSWAYTMSDAIDTLCMQIHYYKRIRSHQIKDHPWTWLHRWRRR